MQHPFDLNQSEPLEKGKLYHFNGKKLVEIEALPGKRVTITNEAMEVVKKVTKGMLNYTEDYNVLDACRDEIANMILEAQAK